MTGQGGGSSPAFWAGRARFGERLRQSLLAMVRGTACDPDISHDDRLAIRRLVRAQPGRSGPILSIGRADDDQRPEDCDPAAEVFTVMTGTRAVPLAGRGECFTVIKPPAGPMSIAGRQRWVG